MSKAAISYGSLKDASSEARNVSKKLNSYADSLENRVYKKLNSYSGTHTQNIQNAYGALGKKIEDLRDRSTAYNNYSSDLDELKTNCSNVDKTVKGMVSTLTGAFKSSHGISNSKIQNGINYFLTSIGNSSSVGRWLGDGKDNWDAKTDYIKQSIEDWWDYEGGKQFVKGMAVAVLEVVVGICAVVGAIATGGWSVALVAALIGGAIGAINGFMNGVNECRAYAATQGGDPAAGRRLSDENTVQDTMRSECNDNVSFWYKVANGIDIVNLGCAVVSIVSSAGKLIKNAYKWTTGSMADIKHLQVRNILTKTNIKEFGAKVKLTIGDGWNEIKSAVRLKNFGNINKFLFDAADDFANNLKNSFCNFHSIEDTASSIGSIASIPKALIEGGFNAKNILINIGMVSIVLPHLNMGSVATYDPENSDLAGSVFSYDFSAIHPDDIYSIFDKIKSDVIKSDVFSNGSILGKRVLEKLSQNCKIDISIPEIRIPATNIPKVDISAAVA